MAIHLSDSPMVPPDSSDTTPEAEELYSSWALTILCILLILSLWTSYYVQIKRIRAVHETVLSIFAGMFVGLIVRLAPGHLIREMLTFKHTLFFNLLLPPIILNSGYELKQDNFFRNFGSILTFAFVGTFISAVGLGVLVYLFSLLAPASLAPTLTPLECLIFGSTLSATDAVTILAIFNQYKVDPKLYSVIFGESILNDAVSIVMYETLSQFHGTDMYLSSFFHGIGIFLLSFSTAMALGVSFGLACSLMLKHSSLNLYPGIESCLVALIAYTSYFASNGMHMSGIVSLLFCGVTLKHYAYHTMSRRTQRTTKYMFSVLAQLSENFIFIYLGLNLFTQDVQVFKPLFILVSTIAVIATRYIAVFPLSELINLVQRARGQRHEELPHSYQMMLFWAGLRGAVGVALAAGFQGPNAAALKTTVLVVVVLTVILFGGTTARMLEVMGIRVGVDDDGNSSDDDALRPEDDRWLGRGWDRPLAVGSQGWDRPGGVQMGNYGPSRASRGQTHRGRQNSLSAPGQIFSAGSEEEDSDTYSDGVEVLPLDRPLLEGAVGQNHRQWSFTALDERYLLPLFSNSVASRSFNARKASRRAAIVGGNTLMGEEDLVDHDVEGSRSRDEGAPHGGFVGSVSDFFRGGRVLSGGTPGEQHPHLAEGASTSANSSPSTPQVGLGPSQRRASLPR